MGTHPIFESDFDCLTDDVTLCVGPAIGRFGKRRVLRHQRRSSRRELVAQIARSVRTHRGSFSAEWRKRRFRLLAPRNWLANSQDNRQKVHEKLGWNANSSSRRREKSCWGAKTQSRKGQRGRKNPRGKKGAQNAGRCAKRGGPPWRKTLL